MRIALVSLAVAATAAPLLASDQASELAPPVRVEAAGKILDVGEVGHAAPCFGDVDGDGKPDLLVGVFGDAGDGKVRVCLNQGTQKEPRFGESTFLMAGSDVAKVPVS